MKKTENYQLNQWEAEDTIRRADFNADNAAIDAALKSIADSVGEPLRVTSGRFVGSRASGIRTYDIGVRPKILFLLNNGWKNTGAYALFGIATPEWGFVLQKDLDVRVGGANFFSFSDTGFSFDPDTFGGLEQSFGMEGSTFLYVAFY